jgi:glycosyltransferase involved in cell wall biosynthesis
VLDIIEKNKHIEKEERKIVFAGHCVEAKGIFELIEACREINNIKLKMIGYVSEETRYILLEKAGANSFEWLEIAGEKDYETTIKEMLSAGIFVLPTYTEGFPNVILESMACTCPIVTTKVGAIPEILDIANGENHGICIDPKNVKQLKDSIQKMLDNREYALQCGKNAQKRVNEIYSMPTVWNELESIWRKLK